MSKKYHLDSDDLKIEKGNLNPKGDFLYPRGVLNVLDVTFRNKKFNRPRGKNSPTFSFDEVQAIAELIFYKPEYIALKIYKRIPRKDELPFKRRVFAIKLVGEANFNGAKAARMAGYSPRSAKQIAYHLLHNC